MHYDELSTQDETCQDPLVTAMLDSLWREHKPESRNHPSLGEFPLAVESKTTTSATSEKLRHDKKSERCHSHTPIQELQHLER